MCCRARCLQTRAHAHQADAAARHTRTRPPRPTQGRPPAFVPPAVLSGPLPTLAAWGHLSEATDTTLCFSVSQAGLARGPPRRSLCFLLASRLAPWSPCSSGLSTSPVLAGLPSGAVLVGLALGALQGRGEREPLWPQAHPTGTRPHLEEATWQLHMQRHLPVNSQVSCQGLTCFTRISSPWMCTRPFLCMGISEDRCHLASPTQSHPG